MLDALDITPIWKGEPLEWYVSASEYNCINYYSGHRDYDGTAWSCGQVVASMDLLVLGFVPNYDQPPWVQGYDRKAVLAIVNRNDS